MIPHLVGFPRRYYFRKNLPLKPIIALSTASSQPGMYACVNLSIRSRAGLALYRMSESALCWSGLSSSSFGYKYFSSFLNRLVSCRGELSYLAPLGSENISAPYFKQCSFRGVITPRRSQTPRLPVPRQVYSYVFKRKKTTFKYQFN